MPRLLLGTEGVKIYRHQMPREMHLPVVFHMDAFAGETAVQMWCLNPTNFQFYPQGASTPEIAAGFIGHENRMALFCHTIGRRIGVGFRRPYILPSCPDTRFYLSLEAVVCKFDHENGQKKKMMFIQLTDLRIKPYGVGCLAALHTKKGILQCQVGYSLMYTHTKILIGFPFFKIFEDMKK